MTTPIYCFNSSILKSSDMFLMISALNTMLPAFCAAWSLKQYYCVAAPSGMKPGSGMCCVFLDTTDAAGTLAYHTEFSNIPFAKVFVKTILQYKGAILMGANNTVPTVAQAFAHEVFEMLCNQNVNVWWQMSSGTLVPAEVTDPVQGNVVPIMVGNVKVGMSDYVLPAWCDPQETRGPFNFLNTLTKPFQLAKGGYMITMKNSAMNYVLGASATPYIQYMANNSSKE